MNEITCDLGDLVAGATATVTLVFTPTVNGVMTNAAVVSANQADPLVADNTARETTRVEPVADLAVLKSDRVDPVRVGDALTYLITVTNRGPSDATGVTLVDPLPVSVDFGSADCSQGSCLAPASGEILCELGSLSRGGKATVTIVVTPTLKGQISNSVQVRVQEYDSDSTDHSAIEQTTVLEGQNELFLPLMSNQASEAHRLISARDSLWRVRSRALNSRVTKR